MRTETMFSPIDLAALESAADAAARQIPPLWPLDTYVAVNPFLGQSGESLETAGARLARLGGVSCTMPRDWYRQKIAGNHITDDDLADALAASASARRPASIDDLKAAARIDRSPASPLPTVADLATRHSGTDWTGLMADRLGNWAGGYIDRGQALWAAPPGDTAWASWRAHATHDLTPEIMGLDGFATLVAGSPENCIEAIARSIHRLGLTTPALGSYFHQLLFSLGGWAQYARHEMWRAELDGRSDATLIDFLAIRLFWEEALFTRFGSGFMDEWSDIRRIHETPPVPDADDILDAILQDAAERAEQRKLSATLAAPSCKPERDRPALQAAFCIDVRSEIFRRALEGIQPSIQTLGFAGFFGIAASHRGFASDVEERRLPVLLNPAVSSDSGGESEQSADLTARHLARAKRAWGRFKLAAVSSFAFVEAMGPIYAGKLLKDGLRRRPSKAPAGPAPRLDPALSLQDRIETAGKVLRAMSLTEGFARVVVLAGHGANVVNNPYASGLHCGACGGHSGEINARLLAGLLNDEAVRKGLAERGITIPADTLFVGALHDTTTDAVTLYDTDMPSDSHASDLERVRNWMTAAGRIARGVRALRLPGAADGNDVTDRARNWAEVRPEWGLAGCNAFIAAPRRRTRGRSLEGRAFLHDYDWQQDEGNGFAVLELIMTAPVVVASWISLQYYGSTVAPEVFGSGNKLLHNVVGGVGVFEGNGGILRGGLPWQSVHDGEDYAHEPLRLSVCIEAPTEAMNDILARHEGVRALFDNHWLHLFAMDQHGRLACRYTGDMTWEPIDGNDTLEEKLAA